METYETLKITNSGNARAFYKWAKGIDSAQLFSITP